MIKKLFQIIVLFTILILTIIHKNEIINFLMDITNKENEAMIFTKQNEYFTGKNYNSYKLVSKGVVKTLEDISNVIYTSLNYGYDEFFFYCEKEYSNCIRDVQEKYNDINYLSDFNNIIHPFNNYKKITTEIAGNKISVNIEKVYSNKQILLINDEVNSIINKNINDNMNDETKIKVIHDYIINNTSYDQERDLNSETNKYQSNNAYGTLFEHKAICGGYTDTMAIFLHKLGIENLKVASSTHIWNYVKLKNEYLHLDLTWDDPINSKGTNMLTHDYFLITTKQLKSKDIKEHNFNENFYSNL
ncbi:MAG: transglutaminase domain-containing protein [Bacilli bacterium]